MSLLNTDLVAASNTLQAKLPTGHRILFAIEAGLVQDWICTNRLLVLVECAGENALLIYLNAKNLTKDSDLERIIPIDSDFKCEIDSSNVSVVTTDIYLKVTRRKLQLLFKVIPDNKANKLVDDILRASEAASKKLGQTDFLWTKEYKAQLEDSVFVNKDSSSDDASVKSMNAKDSFVLNQNSKAELFSIPSPDMSVHRTSLATGGATPIAARESVVRYQMALVEGAYTDLRQLKVFLGTYNVNGQAPTSGLGDWLSADDHPPDIYAVGFQELDLSKEAFLFNETPREDEWLRAVIRALHPKAKYHKVKLVRLVGMMLIVFVQEKHAAYVRAVASETVGTGLMGKMGNKGGVAVRFDLHNSSLCFVNSHLAAHVEEVERRNQDYLDICNRLMFSSNYPAKSIKDHDIVFWVGDLNYRLSCDLDVVKVKELLEQQNYEALLEYDQFKSQYDSRKIFIGYEEAPIKFRPSYKYDPGTDNWDSSEKNRAPAWCDRVLWKGDHVAIVDYRSHPSLRMSDHKPVSCLLDCGIKIIDAVRYRKIYEDVMKKLDKLENEFLPQVSVDKNDIQFGIVHFNEGSTQILTVANTGQVPVQYEFIKKNREATFCKPWLTVEPYTGFLMPGDNAYVTLEILVDKKTAWSLNSGHDTLDDILVLHLDGGKDIFITVSGQYQISCFGCSIETLIHLHQPIKQVSPQHIADLEKAAYVSMECNSDSDSTQPVLAVPKELWFLLDELYRRGLNTPGLFEQPGLSVEIAAIRSALDSSLPDNLPGSVHSVAEALLIFLETLKEPIIPFALMPKALEYSSSLQSCKTVVASLPLSHQHVFKHVISFLKEILLHGNKNGLDAKTLVALFGSAFIRLPPLNYPPMKQCSAVVLLASQQNLERKRSMFVQHFLVNDFEN